jgi:hypothetical protein
MVARLVLALILMPLLNLQTEPVRQDPSMPSEAFILRVTTLSGRLFTVTIPAGARATVGRQNGRTLGLTATRSATGTLELVVTAKDVDAATGAESWPILGQLLVQANETVRFEDAAFPIAVEWAGTLARTAAGPGTATEPCERCCMVCGGEVVCGCRVQTACGECCCPAAACGCGINGQEG